MSLFCPITSNISLISQCETQGQSLRARRAIGYKLGLEPMEILLGEGRR
jgi:hypothetical protein